MPFETVERDFAKPVGTAILSGKKNDELDVLIRVFYTSSSIYIVPYNNVSFCDASFVNDDTSHISHTARSHDKL